jgi:Brp/Blh family beta-carotene 15,15'-monooxygenase
MGLNRLDRQTACATLGRLSVLFGWVPLAVLAVVVLVVDVPPAYRYVPLVTSVVVFGLPHGAVDYVALPRAVTGRVDLRGVVLVSLVYLLLGGGYLALWFLAPLVAAVGFVLLTWFHWGQGELYVLRELFEADHVDDIAQQVLTVVVRGGLPMLVPLFAFPDRYRAVLDSFVGPFGGRVSLPVFEFGPRFALFAVFGTTTAVTLARGWVRATDHRGWRLDAVETGLLWVYFALVPPVLAVGLYFCLWHSVRHIARVLLLDRWTVRALADRRWLLAAGKFGIEAAVPTGLALALVAGLWVAVPGSVADLGSATGLYLVAIAVLTLPHTAVVLVLDREQGVWAWPPGVGDGTGKR